MSLKDERSQQERLAEAMWLQDELRQLAKKEATEAVQKLRLGL